MSVAISCSTLPPPINPTEEPPKTDHLAAYFAGFKTYRVANVLLAEGGVHFKIEPDQGEGAVERDKGHKLLRSAEEFKNARSRPQESPAGHHHSPQFEAKVADVAQATNSVNTDNATSATSGIIVVNSAGTEPLFAEYAAEDNNNYCADGFTGSPADNWPCLDDFVDAGTTFNGHGRGMCQWGTQRWAVNQARDWMWIVNHYYNDNGNPSGARSGVLQLPAGDFSLSATPPSQSVRRNRSTTYTVTVMPVDEFTGRQAGTPFPR
jgi:hypothetical protein